MTGHPKMTEDQSRRRQRMEMVDALSPDIRACVHDFGLSIVQACLDSGVKNARHIRHIVQTVRAGSYQSRKDLAPMTRVEPAA